MNDLDSLPLHTSTNNKLSVERFNDQRMPIVIMQHSPKVFSKNVIISTKKQQSLQTHSFEYFLQFFKTFLQRKNLNCNTAIWKKTCVCFFLNSTVVLVGIFFCVKEDAMQCKPSLYERKQRKKWCLFTDGALFMIAFYFRYFANRRCSTKKISIGFVLAFGY